MIEIELMKHVVQKAASIGVAFTRVNFIKTVLFSTTTSTTGC